MSQTIKWQFEADYLQGCNCDYGCPCEFSAPPTMGYCEGWGVWKISRGNYGEVPLDGLSLGFAAHWPKAIHEGNGTVCIFVDERANPIQRESLIKIASGQAGGLPYEILASTFSKLLPPQFLPFEFHLDGKQSHVKVGKAISGKFGPILNPVTKEPESVMLQHGTGFIFKEAECISADENVVDAGEVKFSWPRKAGFISRIRYGN